MQRDFTGVLEVDTKRGVIYFHTNESESEVTLLRICGLEIPENFGQIDITHMVGATYGPDPNRCPHCGRELGTLDLLVFQPDRT